MWSLAKIPAADLGTGDVAELLDIHPSTVKRWFDSPRTAVTTGGHRRIPLDLVLDVALARDRRVYLHGFGSQATHAWHAMQALERDDPDPACDALVHWLRTRRPHLIGRFLWHVAARGNDPDPGVLDGVFGGFMKRVGDGWERGELRIADERAASREAGEAIGRLLAAAAGDAGGPDPDRPTAVVGAVEPEQHVLGSQLVRLLLLHRGWNVEHLGAGVPVSEIVATQRVLDASLICISFTPPAVAADVLRFVAAAGELADPEQPFSLVLGGNALRGVEVSGRDGAFTDLVALGSLAAFGDWLDDSG
ncbi:MerR family transcriptional regulator [Candidatus Palauibacter sp.]|uniref:MerR family transcriptional regulator n=1 Tax=Candidatus Palauibacter sp. TaxID=3101350 RepID=UPI003D0B728C